MISAASCLECLLHRRRIELEDKAKVVASDWGTESLSSELFCLVFLKQTIEFNHPPCRVSCFASVFLKQMFEVVASDWGTESLPC